MKFNFIDVGSRGVLNKRWTKEYIDNIITFDPADEIGDKTETVFSGKRFHYPYAVFDVAGKRDFYVCRKYRVSSLLKPNLEVLKTTSYLKDLNNFDILETTQVDCIRLDSILRTIDIKFDFLKVDAQGVDLNVIKSTGKFISNFKAIEFEGNLLPIYHGASLFVDIKKYLTKKNFVLFKIIYSSKAKRTIWNDYLFINNDISEQEKNFLKEIYQ